ncbi:ParB/RepB/Spo0J family partition protein [Nioella sp.]|uniref:ParB/RepB/Spo0J family partition protein n=1 Tax=Nioella sp. TaxID=1912091 RepID=UPI003515D193
MDRVKVADVQCTGRLRPVSEAGVESLLASIGEIGVMKDAIHVRQKKNGQLFLIAGGHRLEAARRLGWEEVEAKVWTDVTDDWSRLMEIDDNIAGAELNPLDTALFLAERKRVYEKLHPEAKASTGAALAARRWDAADTMSVASFAVATAEKFGMTDRHVRRLIAAGTRLDPRDVALLRKAPRPITLKDLAEIAKINEPTDRYEVVEALAEGRAKSAADARRALALSDEAVGSVEDPVEAALKALKTAWSRAPKEARRRFCRDHGDELAALLYEGAPE